MVLQNRPTHVALEGIEYNGGTDIKLCIRRSRIWIDQQAAMDRTTQRKFICDTTDTFHFVYPLKGRIYYTKTYDPAMIWYKAEKVGPHPVYYDSIGYGIWPALTLDEYREPLVVFYDTSCSEVIYSYREEVSRVIEGTGLYEYTMYDTVWHSPPCTLDLAGDPGPVAIDYGFGDGVVTNPAGAVPAMLAVGGEGTVHLAYLTRVGNHDELHYAHFPKYDPESITDETIENNLAIDNNRDMGVSIDADILNDKISIAYGCYKDTLGRGDTLPAIYYRERVDTFGWTPAYPFDPSPTSATISRTPGEPLVPFIDPDDGYLRIVLNANDKILFNAKTCSDAFYNWSDTFIVVAQDSNQNRYPQIGGNMITWTKVVGADSNVYACKTPLFNEFKLSIYPEENWFCHVTKADTSAACLYQQGTFLHPEPRWAVYYRGPCGFGGNQENEGPGSRLIPTEPEFSMSVSRNILRGNQFSVFTTGECELAAYDVTGRRIAKLIIEAQPLGGEVETPIDCKKWASGIYFLRAVHEGESSTVIRTEKVVLLR